MDFISVRDLRNQPAKIWKRLREEGELVITNNGKPIAIMSPVDGKNFEKVLRALRKAFVEVSMQEMWKISEDKGTSNMTMEEIENEIKEVRKRS
ncbi:MAG: type II toxin-antitoxin system Phd/YefM family antitoxin [Brevinematia bacterium]